MKASIIINVYSGTDINQLEKLLGDLENQTHENFEVILSVHDKSCVSHITKPYTLLFFEVGECGLSEARNRGAEFADGDVYIFVDDDVRVDKNWIESHIEQYYGKASSVGNSVIPSFPDDEWILPSEFFWVVGGSPPEHMSDEVKHISNAIGCSISVRASEFDRVGGFDELLGKSDKPMQGEEADLAHRMKGWTVLSPNSEVEHIVDESQMGILYWIRRCYWQGVSKAKISGGNDTEEEFLQNLYGWNAERLSEWKERGIKNSIGKSFMSIILTISVGIGFIRGHF